MTSAPSGPWGGMGARVVYLNHHRGQEEAQSTKKARQAVPKRDVQTDDCLLERNRPERSSTRTKAVSNQNRSTHLDHRQEGGVRSWLLRNRSLLSSGGSHCECVMGR